MHRPENVERLAFQRMLRSDNGDLFGKVLMMGSVSYVPSIACSIICYSRRWLDGSKMRR